MTSFRTFLWVSILLMLASCKSKPETVTSSDYVKAIDEWHAERVTRLRSPTGWLNIAGLFWLHDGINSFGVGTENELVFPPVLGVDKAGFFVLENGLVRQTLLPGVNVVNNGAAVKQQQVVFHPDSSRQLVMESGSLRWFVIKRDKKYGIRLRDLNHADLATFNGIERFPVDANWKVIARWEATPGRTIPITNVLGQTTPQSAPGVLVFKLKDKEYRLDALDEGEDELFVIFGDATNAKETYGAGRYLYTPLPDSGGTVVVDFNRSQNPPCAFTEFATCPLPPKQNILDLAVVAGEKDFGHH